MPPPANAIRLRSGDQAGCSAPRASRRRALPEGSTEYSCGGFFGAARWTVRKTILDWAAGAPAAVNDRVEAAASVARTIISVNFTPSLSAPEMKLFRYR